MKRRSNLLLYLVLNVIVSAATTLGVLVLWDRARSSDLPQAAGSSAQTAGALPAPALPTSAPEPTETNPPPGQPVIEIVSVVGAGDLNLEVVTLKRVGEGILHVTGWQLQGDGGGSGRSSTYVFPAQPALALYKDGAVQVYSRLGADTVTELYWNRSEPAWRPGETIRLLDAEGNERAVYQIP